MAKRLNILALDTSSHACTVALLQQKENGESCISEAHRVAPMQHTKLILPMIDDLLTRAGVSVAELDAIALGVGPGSFTGCRLGVSVAQGLSLAHHCPIISVSSLAAMALAAFLSHGHHYYLVCIDARAGQVYWAGYHINDQGWLDCLIPPTLSAVNEVSWPENNQWVGVGDGWGGLSTPPLDEILPDIYPTGAAIAKLAYPDYLEGKFVDPTAIEPAYLR